MDIDIGLLAESDEAGPTDPIDEVDRVLQQAGISTGSDFRDILDYLAPELVTRSILCRCLPGLASQWDRLEHVITDALERIGKQLKLDPSLSLLPLLAEADGLPPGIETCALDPLALVSAEIQALRLLTHDEQRVLGQWIADGQYLIGLCEEHGAQAVSLPRTADLLDACFARLNVSWSTVVQAISEAPRCPAAWRAALLSLGYVGVSDDRLARIVRAVNAPEDEVRADLRAVEAILRTLPDEALAWLADHAHQWRQPPRDRGGHGTEEFVADYPQQCLRAQVARRVMVRHNLRLVLATARPYAPSCRLMTLTDLVQEGTIGLMRAAERWDPNRGYAFSTYATWWIKQAVTRAIADQDLLVRLPVHMVEQVRTALKEYSLHPPSRAERWWLGPFDAEAVAALTRCPSAWRERFDFLLAAGIPAAYATLIAGVLDSESLVGDALELAETLADDDPEEDPEQAALTVELMAHVNLALDSIPARERRVLELRYGLDDKGPRTLKAVGREFGFTRERARQIEVQAVRKLLHPSRAKYLKPLLLDKTPHCSETARGDHQPQDSLPAPARIRRKNKNDWRASPEIVTPVLEHALSDLTPGLRRVVILRYGLHNGKRRTFDEIQYQLGIPRQEIVRMLADALAQIRAAAGTWSLDVLVSGALTRSAYGAR